MCQLLKDHKNDFMSDIMTFYLFERISGETFMDQPLVDWKSVVRFVIVREELFPSLNGSVRRHQKRTSGNQDSENTTQKLEHIVKDRRR